MSKGPLLFRAGRGSAGQPLPAPQERPAGEKPAPVPNGPVEPWFELVTEMLAQLDGQLQLVAVNAAWETVLGWPVEQILGRELTELVSVDFRESLDAHLGALAEGSRSEIALRLLHRDGGERAMLARFHKTSGLLCAALREPAGGDGALGDHLDPLTGLANRQRFTEDLARRLGRAERQPADEIAVLFIDLDGFKSINDSMGHEAGDDLLRVVSRRLRDTIRPADAVGRLGGDEFGVVLTGVRDEREVLGVGERVAAAIEAPIELDGRSVQVTASVGATLRQNGDRGADDLLRRADRAMYSVKPDSRDLRGASRCHVYGPDDARQDQKRRRLDAEIEAACERGELEVVYQPRFALAERTVSGFQALLRWRHPELGLLSPRQFLHLAESRGKLPEIESWLLREAAMVARCAAQDGTPCVVSANLSPATFSRTDLGDHLAAILDAVGLAPAQLQLEVREDVLFRRPVEAKRITDELSRRGIRLYVDGFGTVRSSLSMLHRFALAGVKVDHRFVRQLPDPRITAFLRAVLQLGADLDLDIVAEGVETHRQLGRLRELGFASAEGSRALSMESAIALRNMAPLLLDGQHADELLRFEPLLSDLEGSGDDFA
jgi:diguanylate cyclase (GGDEF)-like protein/PAS domain S-box-containing protein